MAFAKWLCLLIVIKIVNAQQYEIPEMKFEAFSPSGFRVSLPGDQQTQFFAFHGKVNEEIKSTEPGDFYGEVFKSTNGFWVYENPNITLHIGDTVYYWVFVQHDIFGYSKTNKQWNVTELFSKVSPTCETSQSTVSGRMNICRDVTILEDQFQGTHLDTNKWLVEQYIPDEPDFEFVIYKQDDNVIQIKNNQLVIKPKLQTEEEIYQGTLDISNGCTRPESKRSRCRSRMYLLQNPIISGRIVSKTFFSYGDIEIRARLPSGEWMFPELYLEDENYNRLVIAYSRGNKILTGNDGTNIGGSLLFGGPMLGTAEPARSQKLSTYRLGTESFSDKFHTYRLRWTPEQIEMFIDGNRYGNIDSSTIKQFGFASNPPVAARLVLGIGVGGITDFPNDFKSGGVPKPWRDRSSVQVKSFYESRNQWLPSWNTGGQLIVDYIKVKSI